MLLRRLVEWRSKYVLEARQAEVELLNICALTWARHMEVEMCFRGSSNGGRIVKHMCLHTLISTPYFKTCFSIRPPNEGRDVKNHVIYNVIIFTTGRSFDGLISSSRGGRMVKKVLARGLVKWRSKSV